MDKNLSVADVALLLGVSNRRVTAIIKAGRLRAEKVSKIWIIKAVDVENIRRGKEKVA